MSLGKISLLLFLLYLVAVTVYVRSEMQKGKFEVVQDLVDYINYKTSLSRK